MLSGEAKEILDSVCRRWEAVGLSTPEAIALAGRVAGLSDYRIASLTGKSSRAIPVLLDNARRKAAVNQGDVAYVALRSVEGKKEREPHTYPDHEGRKGPDGKVIEHPIRMTAAALDEKARVHANVYPDIEDRVMPTHRAFRAIGA